VAALALAAATRAQEEAPAPETIYTEALRTRLRRHPYLSRIDLLPVVSVAPYLFLIERTEGVDASERARSTAARLEPLRERFERELAKPLGLVRRADEPRLPVIVLASRAHFDECHRATTGAWHFDARETYERELGAAILYEDPSEARDGAEREHSTNHVFAHVLQQAWYGDEGAAPVRSWLFEGQADFLAGAAPADDGAPAPERLQAFVEDCATTERRWAHVRTLGELVTVDEPLHLEELFNERTRDPRLRPAPGDDPWVSFYREGALVYAFLHDGDKGRHRAGLAKYLKSAFGGARDAQALDKAFAPEDAAALERAFLAWVVRRQRAAFPDIELDPEPVLGAFARTEWGGVELPAPEPMAAPEPEPAPTPGAPGVPATSADPKRFGYSDATREERLAGALAAVGAGETRAALAELEALQAEGQGSELAGRIERELARVHAWIAARDAFLTRLAGEGGGLELTVPRVSTTKWRLKAFEPEGMLVLDDKKGGIKRISLEELDALELARQMGGSDAEWTRFYVYALRGDERWKKLLKPDGPEAAALLEDGKGEYPTWIALGRAVRALRGLAAAPEARTPAEIDAQVAVLRSLLTDSAGTALVARKKDGLRQHALQLLERRLEKKSPGDLLGGKFEALPNGRARLTYSFDDARELEDFTSEPYPVLASKAFPTQDGKEGRFTLDHGRLVALGRASLRSKFDIGSPLAVTYDLEFGETQVEKPDFFLALGVCDDGDEHFVWALNMKSLQMFDIGRVDYTPDVPLPLYMDTPYDMHLVHDGQRATLSCEGKEQCRMGVGERREGAVFLRATSDRPVRVGKLVIEGQLTATSFARLKRAWAEGELDRP